MQQFYIIMKNHNGLYSTISKRFSNAEDAKRFYMAMHPAMYCKTYLAYESEEFQALWSWDKINWDLL